MDIQNYRDIIEVLKNYSLGNIDFDTMNSLQGRILGLYFKKWPLKEGVEINYSYSTYSKFEKRNIANL